MYESIFPTGEKNTAFAKYLVPGTVKGKILIDSEA